MGTLIKKSELLRNLCKIREMSVIPIILCIYISLLRLHSVYNIKYFKYNHVKLTCNMDTK